MPRIVDWPARMREVAEFVGLGSAELDVVQSTAPVVLKHGEVLTAAVYDHFLKFDGSRSFFLGEDGEVDELLDVILDWVIFCSAKKTVRRRRRFGEEDGSAKKTVRRRRQ